MSDITFHCGCTGTRTCPAHTQAILDPTNYTYGWVNLPPLTPRLHPDDIEAIAKKVAELLNKP